jgi:signal transduction histidine kinase/DNA-binding response OmpR family regulator
MRLLNDGRAMLVGSQGMNIVHPESLFNPQPAPPLVITKMSINDSVNLSVQSLAAGEPLKLTYHQNVLEFEFAAVDPGAGHLIKYFYRLEGLEDSWVHPMERRFVRYTGLSPGDYVFRVKAASMRGYWPEQEIALAVSIAPPWWRTWWAYAIYGILLVGFVSAAYRLRVRQLNLMHQAEHMAEMDRLKSRFFANISHEFRTPLTLILGPIQKWRDRISPDLQVGVKKSQPNTREGFQPLTNTDELHKDLEMADRNAHRLLRLINQLLDLSRLEAGAMELRTSRMNIVPLVKGIAYSFESSAGMRGVALKVDVEEEEIELYCDREMVEKILSNLLSNAFKFTPAGGKVTLHIPHPTSHIRHHVSISVTDTGIGIPPEQLDRVFDRFYQVDASQPREQEGSGIGLALVKELVELHHGTIQVQSERGRGTTFTVHLPLGRSHLKDDEVVEVPVTVEPIMREEEGTVADEAVGGASEARESGKAKGEKPIVLIVEDHADVRAYIKNYLVSAYQVTEARDGAEGIDKALETVPDLIISDVMMPRKDGYEVCRTLKLDQKTSHIPIILLTARAASESTIEGLETGADDYLIKPFEPKELLARVKNLIDLRRKLRERFRASVPLKPGEVAVTSMDDAFLQKVKSVVETHIGDEGFGVENLGNEVSMSRSQVHRKLTALTGMSASDFIRYLRLHRAMDLLKQNAATVAEIAYSVGFNSPAHFTKCFRDQFGMTPTEARRPEG